MKYSIIISPAIKWSKTVIAGPTHEFCIKQLRNLTNKKIYPEDIDVGYLTKSELFIIKALVNDYIIKSKLDPPEWIGLPTVIEAIKITLGKKSEMLISEIFPNAIKRSLARIDVYTLGDLVGIDTIDLTICRGIGKKYLYLIVQTLYNDYSINIDTKDQRIITELKKLEMI